MCGITAIYYPEATSPPSEETLTRMLDDSLKSIKYPDGYGTFVSRDRRVGLGHHGAQPLSDEDGAIQCVVTGEIYDHERIRAQLEAKGANCKTKSDSELVVQLHRDSFKALSLLRGELAFVLYDMERQLLFAARDRFGIWQPEWDLNSIVNNGYMADDRTVFNGVKKLMPGYFLLCRPNGQVATQT
ncbi:nucleophile aminohydrolase [Mycena crocata]|nr:nucleophile aminohydrolase [Mycena crocata]